MTEQTKPTSAPPEILIVEDGAVEAELLRRCLARAGYQVTIAKNGEEGLQAARARRPALVVSDIRMPLMDGYQLCREIKYDEALWNTPVILLTVLSEPEDIMEAINSGADGYITKPFVEDSLLERIRALLATPISQKRAEERRSEKVEYNGKPYTIIGGSQQVLNLLLSVYENTLSQNRDLARIQTQLNLLNDSLEDQVQERTAALRESEAQISALIEHSPIAMIVDVGVEVDEKILMMNQKFTDLFGYTMEDIPDVRHWWPLAYPDEKYREEIRTEWIGRVEKAIQSHSNIEPMEVTVTCKDGSNRYVSVAFASIRSRNIITFIDLTERKEGEAQIINLNRALRTISACNVELVHAQTEEELFQNVCRQIVETGGYQLAWVEHPGEAEGEPPPFGAYHGDETAYRCHADLATRPEHADLCLAAIALRTRQTQVCNDLVEMPECAFGPLREVGVAAILALPLLHNHDTHGVLTVFSSEPGAFSAAEIKLAEELAGDLAYGIVTLRTRAERERAESQLAEQLEELRRWQQATLGREMRSIELKREVNELLGQAGQPPRYPSVEPDETTG